MLSASDYYWVGGTGYWSDINHWATTSGGNSKHTTVPSALDNVHFDANSFYANGQSVTVNAGNYVCNNMDWTGVMYNPTFNSSGNYSFRIYGSLILSHNMNFDFTNPIMFEGNTSGNTITTAGHDLENHVYFQGNGGEWTLTDDLSIPNNFIYVYSGVLNTNGKTITCENLYAGLPGKYGTLNIDNSQINVTSLFRLYGQYITFSSVNSSINFIDSYGNLSINSIDTIIFNDINFASNIGISNLSTNNYTIFNHVTINNNATISGNNQYNSLTLNGDNYVIKDNNTQYIIDSLVTNSNCNSYTYIKSVSDSIITNIHKASGEINLQYVVLQNIAALGNATFNALNSIDMDRTSGWNITYPETSDKYWVGGAGLWNDPAHWSTTSGGQGGSCVPSPSDNVYFDANSFTSLNQTVNVTNTNIFCKDMDWTGSQNNPVFTGSTSSNLNIWGSLTLNSNMLQYFQGSVFFRAFEENQTVFTAGKAFRNAVTFTGIGSWILLDNFNTGLFPIYLERGALYTNNKTINTAYLISKNENTRGLFLGNSKLYINANKCTAWFLNNKSLSFDAGTSEIYITAENGGIYSTGTDTIEYNNVIFSTSNGNSCLESNNLVSKFNSVLFYNNGLIKGENIYDTLILADEYYRLSDNSNQVIKSYLKLGGNCNSVQNISSSISGIQANIIILSNGDINTQRLMVKDINISGSGNFNAINSFDLGNNSGWNFTVPAYRELYWVGGSGNWNETSHWSLSSGGIGGECIPTSFDNVHFDASSFDTANQQVNINIHFAYCNNMDWSNVTHNPELTGDILNNISIFGSLALTNNMIYSFKGNLYFDAVDTSNTISTGNLMLTSNINFTGNGKWVLQNSLSTNRDIFFNNGNLFSNNQDITCSIFNSNSSLTRTLDLGKSIIKINSSYAYAWNILYLNINLDADEASIEFTAANGGFRHSGSGIVYNKIFFSNNNGNSIFNCINCTVNNLEFKSNGTISNSNTFDTLTFMPSKTYSLAANKTQTINGQLNMNGNGCFPITLRSTVQGTQATISKASGIVSAAYIDMRDQNTAGGAQFFAGAFSSDVANNSGWNFSYAPGYVNGLPDSTRLCPGTTAIINTNNFNGASSFLWQDGSTNPVYNATSTGKYWVIANFANNCNLIDTTTVWQDYNPDFITSSDTGICPGATINLSANIIYGNTLLWNTGQTSESIQVTPQQTESYVVSLTNYCGTVTDTINVTVHPLPYINPISDTAVCEGSSVNIVPDVLPNSIYQWNTGSNLPALNITPENDLTYSLTVTDINNCGAATEEFSVSVLPLPSIVVSSDDTTICEGTSVNLSAQFENGSLVYWNTGDSVSDLNVNPETTTTYQVNLVSDYGCGIVSDEVTIDVIPTPYVNIGEDITICEGSTVSLTANTNTDVDILWNTGSEEKIINVAPVETTVFSVIATSICGISTDDIFINIHEPQQITAQVINETCGLKNGEITITSYGNYNWSTGEKSHSIQNLAPGTYTVTVEDGICISSQKFEVIEIPAPKAAFTVIEPENGDYEKTYSFTNNSTGEGSLNYNWDLGTLTDFSIEENTQHTYTAAGNYVVSLQVTDKNGCTDKATETISIDIFNGFQMPNAFTPNGDGLNDVFYALTSDQSMINNFNMTIMTRWGEVVYNTNDINSGWDGNLAYTNEPAPAGTYTWYISYSESNMQNTPEEKSQIGSVTILK